MRLVLSMSREIGEIADRRVSNNAMWFTAMASPPSAVFERALRLPSQVGALDIDRQLTLFKERARQGSGPPTSPGSRRRKVRSGCGRPSSPSTLPRDPPAAAVTPRLNRLRACA
jgi:hypothetical protein